MKKNWHWAIGPAAVFLLLAAALSLHLKSISFADDANYQDASFQYEMTQGMGRILFGYGEPDNGKRFQASVKGFLAHLGTDKSLVYNLIVLSPEGRTLYKLNDNYLSGSSFVVFGNENGAYLSDSAAITVYKLKMESVLGLDDAVGSEQSVDAFKRWYGDGVHVGSVAGAVNAQYGVTTYENQPQANSDTTYYSFFLYDDATKAYMSEPQTGGIRSEAKRFEAFAIASLAASGLALALWAGLSARGWKRKPRPLRALAALLCLPVLAALCWAALQFFPAKATQEDQEKAWNEKQDEVRFLNTALNMGEYMDGGYQTSADEIKNALSGFNEGMTGQYVLLLLDADGKILVGNQTNSPDGSSYYQFSQNRVFIRWFGGNAYLEYSEFASLVQKFRFSFYDIDHLEGGASAEGSIGTVFDDADAPAREEEFSALGLESGGDMRIYQTVDEAGATIYLIEIVIEDQRAAEPMDEAPVYIDTAAPAARSMLNAALAVLLVLFWLLLPLWVFLDARSRGVKPDGWTALTLGANVLGLAAYLAMRRSGWGSAPAPAGAASRNEGKEIAAQECGAEEAIEVRGIDTAPFIPDVSNAPKNGEEAKHEEREDEGGLNFPFIG